MICLSSIRLFTLLAIMAVLLLAVSAATEEKPLNGIDSDTEDDDADETDEEDFDLDEEKSMSLNNKLKEMYFSWANTDLCKEVQCSRNEYCSIRGKSAICLSKKNKQQKQKSKQHPRDSSTRSHDDKQHDCTPCPVVSPDFICGSDNSTYSSYCRMNFHNCVHQTRIEVACKGFCPCKAAHSNRASRTSHRWADKYPSNERKSIGAKKSDSFAKRKSSKYARDQATNENSVLSDKDLSIAKKLKQQKKTRKCTRTDLDEMGVRLRDWFKVLLTDQKHRRTERQREQKAFKLTDCSRPEISWMFNHLDIDGDLRLSLRELYDLENDRREKCLRQYLGNCDQDRDTFVSPWEWCECFDDSKSQPCWAERHNKSRKGLLGAYVPNCDQDGYYKPTQCHGSSGICWCVDKSGVEFTNTRRGRGERPDCDGMLNRASKHKNDQYATDDDDDDSDGDDDIEASGDGQLNP